MALCKPTSPQPRESVTNYFTVKQFWIARKSRGQKAPVNKIYKKQQAQNSFRRIEKLLKY